MFILNFSLMDGTSIRKMKKSITALKLCLSEYVEELVGWEILIGDEKTGFEVIESGRIPERRQEV